MQRNVKLLIVCLLMVLMLTLVFAASPASTSAPMMVQPMMPWTQPNVYEMYGPRLDNIHYVFEGTPENSVQALNAGDVDIIDWPWMGEWQHPIKVLPYGGDFDYYILDVREDLSKPVAPPWSTQSYCLFGDPTTVTITLPGEDPYTTTRAAAARRAITHLIDKTWIVSTVMKGFGEPIYVPSPAAHGVFNNPYVEKYYQDFNKARELLDDAGVVDSDGDGWRDIPGPQRGVEIILDFFIVMGYLTEQIGNRIADDIEAELNIHVNRIIADSTLAKLHVMVNREMDMYTGHWLPPDIGQFPDHYPYLYSSLEWWPAGTYCPNYMNYPNLETECMRILTAQTIEELIDAAWAAQETMMKHENVYTIPLVSTHAPKAWRTYMKDMPEEPGNEWKGIVNETHKGVNSWWTFLNAHTDNMPDSGSIFYGLSYEDVCMLNPIYSPQPQNWEILDKIYDTMLRKDPISLELKPWMASSFIHVKEYDPVQGEEVSVLYLTIREDVYWHDGEQLTADDINFTLTYVPEKLAERGLPPPSWNRNVDGINRTYIIDHFNIKVYMEYLTFFAPYWAGLNIILPEHIWKPIVDTGNPQAFAPDPYLIGSGPYRVYPLTVDDVYIPTVSMDLYAYKPGSVPGNPHGYFAYSPIQNFIVPGQVGTPVAGSSTYWVGASYVGAVKVVVKIYNNGLYNTIAVTSTLDGQVKTANVPPTSWAGLRFPYPITGGICTTIGPIVFNEQTTWLIPPPPGIDVDTQVIYFKVTVDGDIISTGDIPGGSHVNMYDASILCQNWGPTGPYNYPPADINWDGTVNIFDALWIIANFGKAGC